MLRDCFGPCFRLMLRLPDSPPTGRTDVRREAERLLEEAGRLALRGREAATVETARRMVEAWMDETALGMGRPRRLAGQSTATPLEDGTARRGLVFRRNPPPVSAQGRRCRAGRGRPALPRIRIPRTFL